jgi:transcriptional regulator with XRE-family HTH domain
VPDGSKQQITRPHPREVREAFGASLRRRRVSRGWSQEELAARAGISGSTVSLIEGGKNGPTLTVAVMLAAALETTVDTMTGRAARG